MNHATYIGPRCGWNVEPGMTALTMPSFVEGKVLAQFDDFHAARDGKELAFGWHELPASHFKIEENEDEHVPSKGGEGRP